MSGRKPRPRCYGCDKAITLSRPWQEFPARFRGYGIIRPEDPAPAFCNLRCALRYAMAFVRAGYKLENCCGGMRPGAVPPPGAKRAQFYCDLPGDTRGGLQ